MAERPGPDIEAFIREDQAFQLRVDALGNYRWWHPAMPAANEIHDRWDTWMYTAEALKLRHALADDGETRRADG